MLKNAQRFLLFLIVSSGSVFADDGSVLLKETFDGGSGELAKRLLSQKEVELAKGQGPDGSDAIRVSYVGGSRGSDRVTAQYPLKRGVMAATLSFDVKFDQDFQWVQGGKLHGLGPSNPVTGGNKRRADGWSARLMFQERGRCAFYLYDQDKSKKWGVEETARRTAFKAGKWQHVKYEVTLNEVGKSNGAIKITIDGKSISSERGIEFRGADGPKTLITQLLFSTFHGGHTADWAPKDKSGKFTTVYAYFDNFIVTEGAE